MNPATTDTLVIGGGLSGLRLAQLLEGAGIDWQLMEARERLGGRIVSPTLHGAAIDMGPAWFWPGQPRVTALAQHLSVTVFDQFATGRSRFEDAQGRVGEQVGVASMRGSLRIAGGMGNLCAGIADSLPAEKIHLNQRVTTLERTDDGVRVTCDKGQPVTVRRVVCALPPRLAAMLNCTPALDVQLVQQMTDVPTWMAGQAKAVAIYPKPFWRGEGLSGDAMSQCGPMIEIHDSSPCDSNPGVLFGFIGVPPEQRRNEEALKSEVVAQLVRLFGPQAANPVAVVVRDWAFDPQTATTSDLAPLYSHPRYAPIGPSEGPWHGALYLSGTETAPQFGGFLEGALEAAENTFHFLSQQVR